jgi:hypothetical protein
VKTRIISDEGLHADFARCITLFKDFVKQTAQITNAQLRIAAMSVNDGGGGKSKGEDRWYTLDEWCALPEDEQATIRKTRADRKKKSGGKKTPKGGPKTIRKGSSVQKLKEKVQNQKRQLAAMHAAAKSATDDVGGETMESDSEINKLLNKLSQFLLCTKWIDEGLFDCRDLHHSKVAKERREHIPGGSVSPFGNNPARQMSG